ncbi:hypothetical protein [Fluviispira sanaruensis]|uniref:Uncharacterized protein n=1 Tax=Fluviispira sanaruensis TaxID=2493639 RepID=A0A4P2VXU6_FLUSA|nr:hypothetical protein [Fluviispira sanaruensis]BBH53862.1 hypothetical protein JCM31447_23150 [Fluviispira sanaruensis]
MKEEKFAIMKREVLDMIKCLNSSDLRMNDLNLYCELGAKASLFIELLNGGSETEQENENFEFEDFGEH